MINNFAKKIQRQKKILIAIHTAVIFNDIDLPGCWGMWDFGTPWMSSLNDTDFSNDTDLSVNYFKEISLRIMWRTSIENEVIERIDLEKKTFLKKSTAKIIRKKIFKFTVTLYKNYFCTLTQRLLISTYPT